MTRNDEFLYENKNSKTQWAYWALIVFTTENLEFFFIFFQLAKQEITSSIACIGLVVVVLWYFSCFEPTNEI